jgi:hypothetical protein
MRGRFAPPPWLRVYLHIPNTMVIAARLSGYVSMNSRTWLIAVPQPVVVDQDAPVAVLSDRRTRR